MRVDVMKSQGCEKTRKFLPTAAAALLQQPRLVFASEIAKEGVTTDEVDRRTPFDLPSCDRREPFKQCVNWVLHRVGLARWLKDI